MNFNTVYNACMSKVASMQMEGMYKSAGPNDGTQSGDPVGLTRSVPIFRAMNGPMMADITGNVSPYKSHGTAPAKVTQSVATPPPKLLKSVGRTYGSQNAPVGTPTSNNDYATQSAKPAKGTQSATPANGTQSAQVGTFNTNNTYATQLAANAQAKRKQLVQQARNTPNPKRPGVSPAERAVDTEIILDRPLRYGSDRFVNDWRLMSTAPKGSIITQAQLDAHRQRHAGYQADSLFEQGTNQYDAAKQYLIERGKENQRRYKDGTLWKNEPTKVPMPKVISNPEDVQALDYAGYTMASNNSNKNPNTGYA